MGIETQGFPVSNSTSYTDIYSHVFRCRPASALMPLFRVYSCHPFPFPFHIQLLLPLLPPDQPSLPSFESSFDQFSAQSWTQAHWIPLCAVAGAAYVTLVFTGKATHRVDQSSSCPGLSCMCYFVTSVQLLACPPPPGQSYMSSREPFHLRGALATWSALLAAFRSVTG